MSITDTSVPGDWKLVAQDDFNLPESLAYAKKEPYECTSERMIFLGLDGQQVSNDHYPCYEFLYTGTKGSGDIKFKRSQRFFYDVAGIEGVEWYVIWPYLSLIGITVTSLITIIIMPIRRTLNNHRRE